MNWLELNRSPHAVHFYSSEDFLLDSLSLFVSNALEIGDSVIVIATQVHLDGLAEQLRARGVGTDTATKKGRYFAIEAFEGLAQLTPKDEPSKTRFDEFVRKFVLPLKAAAKGKPQRVAICGEIVALQWAKGKAEAAIELEHFWNELASQGSYSFRCFYPVASFSDSRQSELFMKLCSEHASVIPVDTLPAPTTAEDRVHTLAARVVEFERPRIRA